MRRRFMLLVCGFLLVTLLLPFQAAAAEVGSTVTGESSKSGVTMVEAGGPSIALKEDGTVWTWVGVAPVQVQGLSSVSAVAASDQNYLVIKSDGTVWAWGDNIERQLGECEGTELDYYRSTPVQVCNLSSVVAVTSARYHNLALKSDGTVWAWGDNSKGQLGDGGSYDYSLGPVQVQGLSSVVAIAAGDDHSLALKSDGTVWAWGLNNYGQLGIGRTTSTSSTPVQVQGLSSMVAIAAGNDHNLAVKSDGTVWQWGMTYNGELFNGGSGDLYTPVQVQGLSSVSAVAAGGRSHNLALKSDGTVWAWGDNDYGQLGDGTTTRRYPPVQVQGLGSVATIAAGTSHSLALKSDGTVWAWGYRNKSHTPLQVQGLGESSPEAPEWPTGDVLTVTDVTYNSVQLNWHPATDETGVDKYLVYQDNTLLDTLNGDQRTAELASGYR
ncbi:RCC1 domain-containing protein [Paenibacillus sp. Soil522]|uniref:RCC1 domain-containing protein n=1 Tax=Paenibacillus sp. Soil522 TaxID=1736388 RepID=UPI000700E344|nr:hypothetical protein [Paenibacillus sp. Soil522]KRE21939.1 hypothetical protein ASG81_29290 [Paenibacillus sp. Soil522]